MALIKRLGVVVLLVALFAVPALPAAADGAVVKHDTTWCGVEWAAGIDVVLDPTCDVTNIRNANGRYTLVIHGQIPDGAAMEAFEASGVRHFATRCFVAYLFVIQDGALPVFVDSVRHFTPDGRMTETCHFRQAA